MVVEQTALNLLDDLIACWSSWDAYEDYYLNVHVPNIVRSNGAMKLNPNEKKVVRKLRPLLSHAEWQPPRTLRSLTTVCESGSEQSG